MTRQFDERGFNGREAQASIGGLLFRLKDCEASNGGLGSFFAPRTRVRIVWKDNRDIPVRRTRVRGREASVSPPMEAWD